MGRTADTPLTASGPGPRRLRPRGRAWTAVALASLALSAGGLAHPGEARGAEPSRKVDFNFEVRAILSDKCFKCHGPDARNRKAGLRLDTKEGAFGETPSGARAVVPKDLESSELY